MLDKRFDWLGHALILGCVCCAALAQLIIKWQVNRAGVPPEQLLGKFLFVIRLLLSPWPWFGIAVAGFGGMCWVTSMSRFQLSYSYPFMSLAFVVVLLMSVLMLGETLTWAKLGGTGLVVLGLVVLMR